MSVAFPINGSLQLNGAEVLFNESGSRFKIQKTFYRCWPRCPCAGQGFVTDCLLDYALEEGFTEPIFLNASGEDPDAYFKGQLLPGGESDPRMETCDDRFGRSRQRTPRTNYRNSISFGECKRDGRKRTKRRGINYLWPV